MATAAAPESPHPSHYSVRVDPIQHTAEVFLTIDPGPRCQFGEVRFVGLGDLPEDKIRAIAGIRPQQEYSTQTLESARIALLGLGVFSSVEYQSVLPSDRSSVVPVTFQVSLSPQHTVGLGGGLQMDPLETQAHFTASYQDNNFLGGLRRLTAQIKPGLILFPLSLSFLTVPDKVLPTVQSSAELRQPGFLEARTNVFLRMEYLLYPALYPITSKASEPPVLTGYNEVRPSLGIDRSFFDRRLKLTASYNLQFDAPFTYFSGSTYFSGNLPEGIRSVLISYLSLIQTVDLRDNPLEPHYGMYFSNELQFAGGPLQGDTEDIREQPEVRFYIPVGSRVTLAGRTTVGFLFPKNYGENINNSADPSAQDRDLQLLYFRAFFSGGPNSNRGYPFRGVGPEGIAPFNVGGGQNAARATCFTPPVGANGVPGAAGYLVQANPTLCNLPLGGFSLWEASLELRFELSKTLSTVAFVDSSNVTRTQASVDLQEPHITLGGGIRYATPVGPLRLDVGYAVPSWQCLGHPECDPRTQGAVATLGTVPLAVNIAVGEAF